MLRFSRIPFILFVCLLSVPTALSIGDQAPPWLIQLKGVSVPAYDKKVSAVTLFRERVAAVSSDGRVVTTETSAVKILLREGRHEAIARQLYLTSSSRVKEIRAWLIRPDGTVKEYGKNNTIDIISDPDDVYNEYRVKFIDGTDDADTGAIFGYQATLEEAPQFNQDIFSFQSDLPALLTRYSLNLPTGWKAAGVTFNTNVQPTVNGSAYSWEIRDLPPIANEPASPSFKNLAPLLAVNYSPAEGGQGYKNFKDWVEVSRWNTDLSNASLTIDDAIAAKSQDLTAGAKTELEKIYAIGHFVQNIQYISIDIGVGRGNGYIPRPANLVLSRGYGDCKDKANLVRALLKAQKIDSYLVSIYSGDPYFVREEWPSPVQFNHCIIAIRVSDQTNAPTVITHPTLGRLMIFDATDPYTPVGDLPSYLQGSLALIVAGDQGKLMKMPVTPPESNKMERSTELTLDADGNLSGLIKERSVGQSAAFERRVQRELSPTDYTKRIERWIVDGISTARLSKVTPTDSNAEGRFELDVQFSAPSYAQLMQGRLMVFKPAVVGRLNSLFLTDPIRKNPVMLEPYAFSESSVITLPVGFAVDELPDPAKLDLPFGKYSISYEVKGNKLIFNRSLVLDAAQLPVEKYKSVQDFFVKIRNAEQSPVVLVKK